MPAALRFAKLGDVSPLPSKLLDPSKLRRILGLALLYFVFGRAGLMLPYVGDNVTLIWIPTGLSLAALLVYGLEVWPGILLGAVWVPLAIGTPWHGALIIGLGNTLEALISVELIRRFGRPQAPFHTPIDLLKFFFVAAVVAPFFSASAGCFALWTLGAVDAGSLVVTWLPWYMANGIGALIAAPLFIVVVRSGADFWRISGLEPAIYGFLLLGISIPIWQSDFKAAAHLFPVELLPLPLLIWIALRFRIQGATAAIFVVVLVALSGSVSGRGPFIAESTSESLVPLWMFAFITTFVGLLTAVLAQAQEDAKAAAESANRAKSDFLARVSHEIRTPLNGVIGLARILAQSPLPRRELRMAEQLTSSGESMLSLVNDLLDLSKIEAGSMALDLHELDPRALVKEAAELLRQRAQNKGIELRIHLDDKLPTMLISDSTRLRQVLINLIGNAVKFTDEGAVDVVVELLDGPGGRVGERRFRCTVRDTGCGIEPEAQEAIFRPYRQADASTQRRYGGTGLGLAICREIVELLGGSLTVDSTPGEGSAFCFEVPFLDAGPSPQERPVPTPTLAGRSPSSGWRHLFHILVVDDEPVNQLVTQNELQQLGYLSTCASDGEEALEKLVWDTYDLILMDCQMPKLDGFATAAAIRDSEPAGRRIPIVALTATHLHEGRDPRLDPNLDGVLIKPVPLDDMAETVDGLLLGDEPPPCLEEKVTRRIYDAPDTPRSTFEDLVGTYLRRAWGHLDIMAAALGDATAGAEPEKIVASAHGLKGSSAMVGAAGLAKICRQIEDLAQKDEMPAIRGLLAHAGHELARIEASLKAMVAERASLR